MLAERARRDREAREARERAQREREEREREARAVLERAHALLVSCLDDHQRADYEARNAFIVTSSEGRKFEIARGRAHNIWLLDDQGRRTTCYCGHVASQHNVPDEDNMLTQKLMIETNEAEFLRIANAS